MRLQADILATSPILFILDTVNDDDSGHWAKSLEATIRRVWAANPLTRIILMRFATFTDRTINSTVNSPVNSAALVEFDAIATAYGLTVINWLASVQDLVNNQGHNLTEYVDPDNVHPSTTGYALAATLLEVQLPTGGATEPGSLPARLYDTNGYFETAPTKKLGTAYTSRTGVWSDVGSQVSSSEVGATITYTVTNAPAHSVGCYRVDAGTNNVKLGYDGGARAAANSYQNGTEVVAGFTTVTIEVVSGTVEIDEFWAV